MVYGSAQKGGMDAFLNSIWMSAKGAQYGHEGRNILNLVGNIIRNIPPVRIFCNVTKTSTSVANNSHCFMCVYSLRLVLSSDICLSLFSRWHSQNQRTFKLCLSPFWTTFWACQVLLDWFVQL